MKKHLSVFVVALLVGLLSFFNPLPLSADDDTKETDRVMNAGKVAKEIMNVPDDIPQSLIDKADCVIVFRQCSRPRLLWARVMAGA